MTTFPRPLAFPVPLRIRRWVLPLCQLLLASALPIPAHALQVRGAIPQANNASVRMPSLVKLPLAQALGMLKEAGFQSIQVDTVPNSAEGDVIRQTPDAGTLVTAATRVFLVVGGAQTVPVDPVVTQPRRVRVPNVVGSTLTAAEGLLRSSELALAAVDTVEQAGGAGRIGAQSPAAGETVAPRTGVRVTLTVPVRTVLVPNVVGRTPVEAQALLKEAGLGPTAVDTVIRLGGDGRVSAQRPGSGASVAPQTPVLIQIAVAPPPEPLPPRPPQPEPQPEQPLPPRPPPPQQPLVRVPNLIGNTLGGAAGLLSNARLGLATVDTVEVAGGNGRVDAQSPGAGVAVELGSAVRVRVAVSPPPPQSLPPQPLPAQPVQPPVAQRPPQSTQPSPPPARGQALVRVPNLLGSTVGDASSLLQEVQLSLAAADTIRSASGDGRIYAQSPRAGELVAARTGIRVQLSLAAQVPPDSVGGLPPGTAQPNNQTTPGQQPTLVAVPDLAGLSTAEAERRLIAAGLQRGAIELVRSEAGTGGTVLAQAPAAGVFVLPGTPVALTAVRAGFGLGRIAIVALGLLLLVLGAIALQRRVRHGQQVAKQPPRTTSPQPRLHPMTAPASYELELTGPLFRGPPLHIRPRADRGEIELVSRESLIERGGLDG